jgi:hypothetical protein
MQNNLRCGECGQSCGLIGQAEPGRLDGVPDGFRTTLGDLLSAVLRHRVMAHDQALNRSSNGPLPGHGAGAAAQQQQPRG